MLNWFLQKINEARRQNPVAPSPEQAEAILKQDLPTGTAATVLFDTEDKATINIHGVTGIDGAFNAECTLDLPHKTADAGEMEVKPSGQGLGRIVLRNSIELLQLYGVKKFNVYASLEAGAYAWARYGFLPEKGELPDLTWEIKNRYSAERPLLSNDEQKKFDPLVDLQSPKDLWALVDTRLDMAPRLKNIFNKKSCDTMAQKFAIKWADVTENKEYTLARVLLEGTAWHGYLDLTDRRQMARVKKYVGEWKSPR